MRLRSSVPLVLLVTVAVFAATMGWRPVGPPPAGLEAQAGTAPPNVLIIVTDDQRWDTVTPEVMPHTRRWFHEGGRAYPNAFATTPVCCPSRSTIMTGQYAHNHGVRGNGVSRMGIQHLRHDRTLQYHLRRAGYRTAIMGRYLNGWSVAHDPPHFDEWAILRRGYRNVEFNLNGQTRPVRRYVTDFLADRAARFVAGAAGDEDTRPWFLLVTPTAPHRPFPPAARHRRAHVGPVPRTPAFLEADRRDKPPYVQDLHATVAEARAERRGQLRALMAVDDLVGRVMSTLAETGQLRDTLAIFVSDNGYLLGEHHIIGKRAPYTESIRIPMAMHWPKGVEGGHEDPRIVTTVDIAPTVLGAAGIAPDHELDGRSVLSGSWSRDRLLTEHWRGHPNPTPHWASLRTSTYHYIEYYGDGRVQAWEYYDLIRDPYQVDNLLGDGDPSTDPPGLMAIRGQLLLDRVCAGTGPAGCP